MWPSKAKSYLTLSDKSDTHRHVLTRADARAHARMFGHMFPDGRTSADTLTQQSRPVYILLHTDAGAIHYSGGGGLIRE